MPEHQEQEETQEEIQITDERLKEIQALLESKTRSKNVILSMITTILIGVIASVLASFMFPTEKSTFVSKYTIQKEITQAVSNGADLRAIKQIYKNRSIEKRSIFDVFIVFGSEKNPYPSDIPLSTILEDIRANQFLTEKRNPDLIIKLDEVIKTYYATNPFDKLEPNQKDFFENIRIKLAGNYDAVQSDMHKISDELYNKNALVTKYLKDSTLSFWVSIAALIFSFVISIVQLYQGRKSATQAMIFSAVLAATGGSKRQK